MANKLLVQILDSGIDATTDFPEKRKIRTINIIGLAVALVNALYIPRMVLMGLPQFVLLHVLVVLLMISVVVLNKYHRYMLSRIVFFTAVPYALFISALFFKFGAENYLFPLFIAAAFIFEKTKRSSLIIYFIFLTILYAVIIGGFISEPGISIDPTLLTIIQVINAVVAMVFIFMAIGLFTREHEINRLSILKQKLQLEKTSKELEENVQYSNLLTKEMSHRVKNNLQLISSLLNIHAKKLPDETSRKAIIDAKNRIFAIALIHKQLYAESNISIISMPDYLNDLLSHIRESVITEHIDFEMDMTSDEFSVCIDDAISIGLLINELVTNAVKHGLNNSQDKRIKIVVKVLEDDKIFLSVQDGGIGIQKFADPNKHGFGFELVESMVANFDGQLAIDEEENKITIQLNCIAEKHVLV